MGVDQYLLKPIIKEKMVEILLEMYERLEEEQQQKNILRTLEGSPRIRKFFTKKLFEQIITGGLVYLKYQKQQKRWV